MSKIPKNIFQTHKSLRYLKTKPYLMDSVQTWIKYSKSNNNINSNQFNYFFYTNKLCDEFMKNKIGGKIFKAYNLLPVSVMKADLWRYCIIFYYGGIYADVDTKCLVNPSILLKHSNFLVCTPEGNTPWFCQWVFAAPRFSPVLKTIIELSVKRIFDYNFNTSINVHYLTGPEVFTDGIKLYLINNNKPVFNNPTEFYNISYKDTLLAVFNHEIFHNKIIKHLFAGADHDGWKNDYKLNNK